MLRLLARVSELHALMPDALDEDERWPKGRPMNDDAFESELRKRVTTLERELGDHHG